MTTAVLLTTMRCNIRCAHCSVDSHPGRDERMPVAAALGYLRRLAAEPEIDFVDLSGGEPLIHLDDVKTLAREAHRLGLRMRITSNGSWARSVAKARRILCELHEAGIASVGLSIDEWHLPYVPETFVANYLAACRELGMQSLLSVVVRVAPSRGALPGLPRALLDVLGRYGIDQQALIECGEWETLRLAMPVAERPGFERDSAQRRVLVAWQVLTAEGRGRALDPIVEPLATALPEPCPAAGDLPTIDPEGRLYPCCSPWTARKDHAFAQTTEVSLADDLRRMRASALVRLIHAQGPLRLIRALSAIGIDFESGHSGICNQCGQLLDRLSLDELEAAADWLLRHDRDAPAYAMLDMQPKEKLRDALVATSARRAPPRSHVRIVEVKQR
jgi:hypothetical protein